MVEHVFQLKYYSIIRTCDILVSGTKETKLCDLCFFFPLQMIIYKLLDTWGLDGFLEHTETVASFYEERRDVMLAAVEKHLTGIHSFHQVL